MRTVLYAMVCVLFWAKNPWRVVQLPLCGVVVGRTSAKRAKWTVEKRFLFIKPFSFSLSLSVVVGSKALSNVTTKEGKCFFFVFVLYF